MDTFGRNIRITISGASHAESVGVVISGIPAGLPLTGDDFKKDIIRRAPNYLGSTPRKESDEPIISGGLADGVTTGEDIVITFLNKNVRDEDYIRFADIPRPGHADRVAAIKYGASNDPRGGGKFSGRMTLPLVAAGTVARKMLSLKGISLDARVVCLGGESDEDRWLDLIAATMAEGDSLGGVVECTINGVPVGVGEPFFDSVESLISHAVFSIPGVRGIEFGDGFAASSMKGSEHNDPWTADGPAKNGAGGINGGITNGAPVVFRVAFKPTSSIARAQRTYNFGTGRMDVLEIGGRHDCCFVLRTPVIVESVAALVIADLLQ